MKILRSLNEKFVLIDGLIENQLEETVRVVFLRFRSHESGKLRIALVYLSDLECYAQFGLVGPVMLLDNNRFESVILKAVQVENINLSKIESHHGKCKKELPSEVLMSFYGIKPFLLKSTNGHEYNFVITPDNYVRIIGGPTGYESASIKYIIDDYEENQCRFGWMACLNKLYFPQSTMERLGQLLKNYENL